MDGLMVFAPILPFVLLALWGISKQRNNPALPAALGGGVALAVVGISVGLLVSFTVAVAIVALMAIGWGLSLCLR